jgi:predicted O-methyltransferase YrrM
VLDADAATLMSLMARSRNPQRVLEVGTGVGLVTMHLARAVSDDCVITSIEASPQLQGQAHAFLARVDAACAIELRLGNALRLVDEVVQDGELDLVVLSDPRLPRLELLDQLTPCLASDALLFVPFALHGGRVAHAVVDQTWHRENSVEAQRAMNRHVAADARFADVTLLPVGDGLLIARRCG